MAYCKYDTHPNNLCMLSFNGKVQSSLLVNILDIQVSIALKDIQSIRALSSQQFTYRQGSQLGH